MYRTINILFDDPDAFFHSVDDGAALFVPMDRAAYHRSIFLDGRISAATGEATRVPVAALTAADRAPQRINWIFHMAHGGSTLLARALDRLDGNLVLREPQALRQIALDPGRAALRTALALLSKRYRPDLPTLIKANVPVNFIAAEIAGALPDARAIFLYAPLTDYLLAVLRSEGHRHWVRAVTGQLAAHLGDLSTLSDSARAAALWLAQCEAFARIAALPGARTVQSELFFSDPRAVVEASAAHLGVPMTGAQTDAVVAGPLFETYSKNPALAFDNAARLARSKGLARQLAAEVAEALAWLERRDGRGERAMATLHAARLLR